MKDSKQLTRFLFGESQTESLIDETFAEIWEQLNLESETAEPKNRKPLKKALKELGLECCIQFDVCDEDGVTYLILGCSDEYNQSLSILSEPESLEKLSDMGWVHNPAGEFTQEGEDPKFKIEFIEIACDDGNDSDTPSASAAEIMKAAIDVADKNPGEYHDSKAITESVRQEDAALLNRLKPGFNFTYDKRGFITASREGHTWMVTGSPGAYHVGSAETAPLPPKEHEFHYGDVRSWPESETFETLEEIAGLIETEFHGMSIDDGMFESEDMVAESACRKLIESDEDISTEEAIERAQEEEDRKNALKKPANVKGPDKSRIRNHASTHNDAPR